MSYSILTFHRCPTWDKNLVCLSFLPLFPKYIKIASWCLKIHVPIFFTCIAPQEQSVFHCPLVYLCPNSILLSTRHSIVSLEKRETQLKKLSQSDWSISESPSWLMFEVGECSPLWVAQFLGWCSWTINQGWFEYKPVCRLSSKRHPSLLLYFLAMQLTPWLKAVLCEMAIRPDFKFLPWVLTLTSFNDRL